MATFLQDLRYGARLLRKNPAWSAVALLALALGIGANTAMFSVLNTVLLRPLPFPHAERLVRIFGSSGDVRTIGVSINKLETVQQQSRTVEQAGAYFGRTFAFSKGERPEQIPGAWVTANLFATFGVTPLLGRTFSAAEDSPGGADVAIVSYGLWQRLLGGDPHVIGTQASIDGRQRTIVGVLPRNFQMYFSGDEPEVFLPRIWETPIVPLATIRSGASLFMVVGRLRAGATLAEAQSELNLINQRYKQAYPSFADAPTMGLAASWFTEDVVGDVRPALLMLQGAVGLVLLIACANVANLLLARSAQRRKEIALRLALGATRVRLMRQWLAESTLLALLGGGLGTAAAWYGVGLLRVAGPESVPRLHEAQVDGHALLFAMGVSLIAAVVFGLAPSWHMSRYEVNSGLQQGGRSGPGRQANRTRDALVVAEISVSLVLLVGSALLLQSLVRLEAVNPGFDPRHVFVGAVSLPNSRYGEPRQKVEFVRKAMERVRALPGVESAGATSALPVNGGNFGVSAYAEPHPSLGMGRDPMVFVQEITPGYFSSLRTRVLKGRDFSDSDAAGSLLVAIVNEAAVHQYWRNEDPIGKHIANSRDRIQRVVVGVVPDVKYMAQAGAAQPTMYLPYAQVTWPTMFLTARTAGDPLAITGAVREAVRAMDAEEPVANPQTMEAAIAGSLAGPRFRTVLLESFAALALLLCCIGVYGVMAYSVAQRNKEIGIRMALGAKGRDVHRMVIAQAGKLAAMGIVLGGAGALAATRMLKTMLFATSATDPLAFAVGGAVLAAMALLASYVPARRAARVDPMVVLKEL